MTDKKTNPTEEAANDPTVTIRMPLEMRDELDAYCAAHDRKRSSVIRLALKAFFAQERNHD